MDEKRKGYFGLNWILSFLIALFPLTSWICGAIERIKRGHIVAGIFQLIPPITFFFYIVDILTMLLMQNITIAA